MTRSNCFLIFFFFGWIFRGSMAVLLGRQSKLQKQKLKNLRSVHHQLFQVLMKMVFPSFTMNSYNYL